MDTKKIIFLFQIMHQKRKEVKLKFNSLGGKFIIYLNVNRVFKFIMKTYLEHT
jgi:hypothetical protein